MLTHIHHINFVVQNLDESILYFDKLLSMPAQIESLAERKVKTARYQIGETFLVLVQPLSATGVVADILKNKGEGIFLMSFATESIDDTLQQLEISYRDKRKGLDNWSICDLSPAEQFGAILQLTQTGKTP